MENFIFFPLIITVNVSVLVSLVIFNCLYHCIIVYFIQQFSPSRLQVCSIKSVQFSSVVSKEDCAS